MTTLGSTKCQLIYSDWSDDAALTGGAFAWDDLTNLQDPRLSLKATSVSNPTGIRIDGVSSRSLTYVVLVGTNLVPGATVTVAAYSDAWITQTFSVGPVSATTASALSDPDAKGLDVVIPLGQTVTARYWTIAITNTSSPDVGVSIARLHLGTALSSTFNFADGAAFTRDPNTTSQKALGGASYFSRHRNIRSWSLSYPLEAYDTAWDEFDHMVEISGIDRFVYVVAHPDDTDRMYRHSFLGTLSKTSGLRMLIIGRAATGVDITEYVA